MSCFRVLCMHTRRQYVACVIGVNWLKPQAHTHFVGMCGRCGMFKRVVFVCV